MVWLTVWSEGVAPFILFEKGTLDHHRYIKEVLAVALRYGNSKCGNNWTFQQDNGTPHTHQETQEWCSQYFLARIHGQQIVPIIWDKFAQAINWDQVTSKSSLIAELKRGVKKIRLYVVRESCSVWMNHLYRMTHNDGSYLGDKKQPV